MKKHVMKLNLKPMESMKKGKKTIELRLYDEKRQQISIGDYITFVNTQDDNDTLMTIVENLYVFDSFNTLYQNLPLTECGYDLDELDTASPKDMELYYSKEKQSLYGVVGIKIKIL